MKPNQLFFFLLTAMFLFNCKSKNTTNDPQKLASKMRVEIIDPEALKILDSTASIEVIAEGFKWTEGPLYIKDGGYFIFSDIPENKIWKWKEGQEVVTYLKPSGNTGPPTTAKEPGSNGLVLNAEGSLVLCQVTTLTRASCESGRRSVFRRHLRVTMRRLSAVSSSTSSVLLPPPPT